MRVTASVDRSDGTLSVLIRWESLVLRITDPEDRDFDFDAGLGRPDTLRMWVSDRQWLSMLKRIELGHGNPYADGASEATGERGHARVAGDFRCMIRLGCAGDTDSEHGIYAVRTRNVGGGGVGFTHDRELHAGLRCTVALQPNEGPGLVIAGRVAWCRSVDRGPEDPVDYEVGVQFDQPVDLDSFVNAA